MSAQGRKSQTQFRRNESGYLDLKSAIRAKTNDLHMNYSDEACFFFGIALVGGEGMRLEPFKQTSKNVVLY